MFQIKDSTFEGSQYPARLRAATFDGWLAAKKQLQKDPKPRQFVSCRMKNAVGVLGTILCAVREELPSLHSTSFTEYICAKYWTWWTDLTACVNLKLPEVICTRLMLHKYQGRPHRSANPARTEVQKRTETFEDNFHGLLGASACALGATELAELWCPIFKL